VITQTLWLNQLSNRWPIGRVKDHVVLTNGFPFDSQSFSQSAGVRLVRIRDLTDGGDVTYLEGTVPRTTLIDSGDVIVGMDGDFNAVTWSGGSAALNQRLCVLRSRPSLDQRFLAYVLPLPLKAINDVTYFTTVKHLSSADLLGERIPVPPLSAQRAIADYLDRETARIDALIEAKRRMVELLGQRWQAIRNYKILHGFDPLTGSGCLPNKWQLRNLGSTVTLQRGHDLPSDRRSPGPIPVVSSGGVSGWHNQAACEPPGVVTGRYGTIGDTYFVDVPYWPLNTTLFVSDFRGNDPRWVFHALAALPLTVDAEKSAVTGINRNVIGMLKIPVPPVRDQEQLAQDIDASMVQSSNIVHRLDRQIELLQEHRQTLITAAVTGELEIPEAAA
jgi:type I restriction enzyme S subunit